MVKVLPVFIAGISLGAVGAWAVFGHSTPQISPPQGPPPTTLQCDSPDPTAAARVAQLEDEVRKLRETRASSVESPAPAHAVTLESEQVGGEAEKREKAESLQWRISAIEKFVPLTDEQRDRLRQKYSAEREARVSGQEARTESLEEILGDENARYYREQVDAAFRRMQDAEIEKEVLLLSRQLSLPREQEEGVRSVFVTVERSIRDAESSQSEGSAHERVKTMVEENKRRATLRSEELRKILTPEQYQRYVALEAESPASDVEVFHDSGK